MPDMKLTKLPDRTPVKMTIAILPELANALEAYATLYEATYRQKESIADLIPFMLANFLESDRSFQLWRRGTKDPASTTSRSEALPSRRSETE